LTIEYKKTIKTIADHSLTITKLANILLVSTILPQNVFQIFYYNKFYWAFGLFDGNVS